MIPPYVVEEFLLWLWFLSDNGSVVEFSEPDADWAYPPDRPTMLDVWVDGKLNLEKDGARAVFSSDQMGNDAKEALRIGKNVSGLRLGVRESGVEYRYVLGLNLFRLKLTPPAVEFEDASTVAAVFGTVAVVRRAEQLLDHLFFEFVQRRATEPVVLTEQLSSFIQDQIEVAPAE